MKRFKDILCIAEPGQEYKPALDRAITLAQTNQAKLTVIAVAPTVRAGIGIPETGSISAELQAAKIDSHKHLLINSIRITSNKGKNYNHVFNDLLPLKIPYEYGYLVYLFSDKLNLDFHGREELMINIDVTIVRVDGEYRNNLEIIFSPYLDKGEYWYNPFPGV